MSGISHRAWHRIKLLRNRNFPFLIASFNSLDIPWPLSSSHFLCLALILVDPEGRAEAWCQEPRPQALGSTLTLGHMPKEVAWRVLQAWPWKYATTLAQSTETSSDPRSLTPGRTFPQQPALLHVSTGGA